jgi:hypothetical protein
VPPVRGKVGRPRKRPDRVTADRGYDHDKYRRELRRRGIGSEIARRKTQHCTGSVGSIQVIGWSTNLRMLYGSWGVGPSRRAGFPSVPLLYSPQHHKAG